MKEFIFDRKDYKSYKDFYKDIAVKMGSLEIEDYYDNTNFEYNPNILWEFLTCVFGYTKSRIKIILKNFNINNMKPEKKYEDFCLNVIIQTFKDFITKFPDNTIEFIDEE